MALMADIIYSVPGSMTKRIKQFQLLPVVLWKQYTEPKQSRRIVLLVIDAVSSTTDMLVLFAVPCYEYLLCSTLNNDNSGSSKYFSRRIEFLHKLIRTKIYYSWNKLLKECHKNLWLVVFHKIVVLFYHLFLSVMTEKK